MTLFSCPRQNINHSSENVKVIYIKRSMFYAIVNSSQVKSTSLILGRVALSAIAWYQKGPRVNYDYMLRI